MSAAQEFRQIYNDFIINGTPPGEIILAFPRRQRGQSLEHEHEHVLEIAAELYPTIQLDEDEAPLSSLIKYKRDLRVLRRAHRTHMAEVSTYQNSVVSTTNHLQDSILRQGPWQSDIDPASAPPSLPMPVSISDLESLQPFFAYL